MDGMIAGGAGRMMAAEFLFIMDPPETLNLETETSLLLMQELIRRGHGVHWVQQEDVWLAHDCPTGMAARVVSVEPLVRAAPVRSSLNMFDAVVVRKDPPFDLEYLHLTQILDHLDPRVAQFNEVKALRNFNEKMLPLRWPELTPPTLISMNTDEIERFGREHGSLVVKPVNDCSGRGIRKVDLEVPSRGERGQAGERRQGSAWRRLIREAVTGEDGKPRFVLVQKYLAAVEDGDKRVYLVDGEPVGMVNRIPRPGSFLANIHQGAVSVPTELSEREDFAIRKIAPFLRKHGILLAGADFIGGYLTELNITSPSAVRQINEVSGDRVERRIVDAMLERLGRRACCDDRPIDVAWPACCRGIERGLSGGFHGGGRQESV